MKVVMLLVLFTSPIFCTQMSAQSFSETGYPEHFAAGMIIGGVTSYLVFKKTDNKFKAWVIGAGIATGIGLLKEIVDPAFGRQRNLKDFQYTALGGFIGATIIIPLRRRQKKGESELVMFKF